MKRIIILIAAFLLVAPSVTMAQKKGKKEVNPILEGKKKVRKTDYDSVWRFTTFNTKKKYYCKFNYLTFNSINDKDKPIKDSKQLIWGDFKPVMNFLETNTRVPVKICAIYAINPSITDKVKRMRLEQQAADSAKVALENFSDWMKSHNYRNKINIQVAQIDYRYWWGVDYLNMEKPTDDIIIVGEVLFFASKKIDFFPNAADGAKTFKTIKFLPNSTELMYSFDTELDELADYLKDNERLEVLLKSYSDDNGTETYNIAITKKRAEAIRSALVKRNIAPHRVEIEALGSENPIGDNQTYEGKVANNRVDVVIQ
ncbi:MAG: OmpA family protein [Bacteroidales bacterium]|nr:OmpA family protein [Bacteroidales bacterium]